VRGYHFQKLVYAELGTCFLISSRLRIRLPVRNPLALALSHSFWTLIFTFFNFAPAPCFLHSYFRALSFSRSCVYTNIQQGEDSQIRTIAVKGQSEMDRNGTGRAEQAELDSQNRTSRTRLPEQGCLSRTAREVLPGQDCQERSTRTGFSEQGHQYRTARTGLSANDC
jgi:hypothetical protein